LRRLRGVSQRRARSRRDATRLNNAKLRVLACESALHYDYPQELQAVLKDYNSAPNDERLSVSQIEGGHYPSSLWLQTA
jgi:hypothetical protein